MLLGQVVDPDVARSIEAQVPQQRADLEAERDRKRPRLVGRRAWPMPRTASALTPRRWSCPYSTKDSGIGQSPADRAPSRKK